MPLTAFCKLSFSLFGCVFHVCASSACVSDAVVGSELPACYTNEECETTVGTAEPVTSAATEIQRPKRLSLSGTSVPVEGSQTVWNEGRRFSADLLSVTAVPDDKRSPTVNRLQQVSARGRGPTRTSRLPPVVQTSQRRPSQPTAGRSRQSPSDFCRRTTRRFSDNGGAVACSCGGRDGRRDLDTSAATPSPLWTNVQLTAFTRRQSVQSNPPATVRDQRTAARKSSEGRGLTKVDTWWTKSARRQSSSSRDRQTESLEQTDRQLPPWAVYRKRRSAPEVAFSRSRRRESTSSNRQTTGDGCCDQLTEQRELQPLDRNETARRRRWNATTAMRLTDDSFDSVLMSDLPSPTDTVGSDYGSAGSLSDIARGRRKDSGFRSIDTASSYGASRKSSTSTCGMRRQSIQTATDVGDRRPSVPFEANPFGLPDRPSRRPMPTGPRSSGRRQSMFTRSDEMGSRDSDWLNEWLRWRSGCSDSNEIEPPDFERQAMSIHHGTGVWNSLSEKVERTFEGFDRVINRATALLHDRRMSSDSENQIEF